MFTCNALEDQPNNLLQNSKQKQKQFAGLNSDPNGLVVSEFCTQIVETISTKFMKIAESCGAI